MKFWLYMVTVILSLPKTMIFVALGNSDSETSKVAKYGKILAILVVVGISSKHSRFTFVLPVPALLTFRT